MNLIGGSIVSIELAIMKKGKLVPVPDEEVENERNDVSPRSFMIISIEDEEQVIHDYAIRVKDGMFFTTKFMSILKRVGDPIAKAGLAAMAKTGKDRKG